MFVISDRTVDISNTFCIGQNKCYVTYLYLILDSCGFAMLLGKVLHTELLLKKVGYVWNFIRVTSLESKTFTFVDGHKHSYKTQFFEVLEMCCPFEFLLKISNILMKKLSSISLFSYSSAPKNHVLEKWMINPLSSIVNSTITIKYVFSLLRRTDSSELLQNILKSWAVEFYPSPNKRTSLISNWNGL